MVSLKSLWGRTAGVLGISFYTKSFLRFVRVHLLFTAAVNLSGVFLSIFIVRAGGTAADICLYYIFAYGFEMTGNLFMPRMLSRFSRTALNRAGMLMYLVSYVTLLSVQERVVAIFPVIAALSALGASLYWLPYHYFCVSLTTPEIRQPAMSFMGLATNVIVLVVPLASGFITGRMEGMSGYVVIFSVSAVCFLAAIFISRKLPAQRAGAPRRVMRPFLKKEFFRASVFFVFLTNVLYGVREGVYSYYFNLLIYDRISSEFVLGLNITGRSIMAVLTFFVMGKILTPKRRIRWNFHVLAAEILLSAALLLWNGAAAVMVVYIADAALVTFIGNSLQFCTYEAADALPPAEGGKDAMMGMRIAALNLGRVLGIAGLLAVMTVSGRDGAMIWPLVALNGVAFLSAITMWRSNRAIVREKAVE